MTDAVNKRDLNVVIASLNQTNARLVALEERVDELIRTMIDYISAHTDDGK